MWIIAPKLDNIFHISVICIYSGYVWFGLVRNGAKVRMDAHMPPMTNSYHNSRKGMCWKVDEVLVQNFTSSVPLFSMCGCNQEGCKQFREAIKIHILYQATAYISGWVNAFIYLVKSKMQPGGMQTVQRGHQGSHPDSHPISGNSIHQWLCECTYLVKTNALDLLVGSYWYINSL